MSALVCDDPQTGSHEASPEGVNCPKGKPGSAVEEWMRQLEDLRRYEPLEVERGFVEGG